MSVRLTSDQIRSRFLAFFAKREHLVIPSASLVTSDEKGVTNPTLFNTAGMQPLVPYLLGKQYLHDGKEITRLVDVQKCLRTVDIDDIGDNTHATFFEMLGNWSLGDYFKKEAIEWSYEFLTSTSDTPGDQGLGLNPAQLYVTVFEGDEHAPRDDEAASIWRDIFSKNNIEVGGDTSKAEKGRIFYLPAQNNWWEAGDNGPCGPDTEMFYDISNTFAGNTVSYEEFIRADTDRSVVEVWNDVFMQYEKKDGVITGKLPKPSVDTGAGLERLTMTLQDVDNIYDTDLFAPILTITKNLSLTIKSARIIADHIRSSVFMISDGVIPSNTDRGYILRRLIRRAIVNTTNKKLDSDSISLFVDTLVDIYKDAYPEFSHNTGLIKKVLTEESVKFADALVQGMKEFEKSIPLDSENSSLSTEIPKFLPSKIVFDLYQSHGFPIELTKEIAAERGLIINESEVKSLFKNHQELSRAGAEQKFKGGLADAQDPMVVRYHTATHLLHQALHDVLGEDAGNQKGSNITTERLRFDFTGTKLTDEQKKKVESIVNEKITQKLPMQNVIMSKSKAEQTGARRFFGEKYGEDISIYFIGNSIDSAYSKEFCGGPHVKNTHELAGPDGTWVFKIQKEEAVSQGVRRIKAVLE